MGKRRPRDPHNTWMKNIRKALSPGMVFYADIRPGKKQEAIRRYCKVVDIYDRFVVIEHKTPYEDRYCTCYRYDEIARALEKKTIWFQNKEKPAAREMTTGVQEAHA